MNGPISWTNSDHRPWSVATMMPPGLSHETRCDMIPRVTGRDVWVNSEPTHDALIRARELDGRKIFVGVERDRPECRAKVYAGSIEVACMDFSGREEMHQMTEDPAMPAGQVEHAVDVAEPCLMCRPRRSPRLRPGRSSSIPRQASSRTAISYRRLLRHDSFAVGLRCTRSHHS